MVEFFGAEIIVSIQTISILKPFVQNCIESNIVLFKKYVNKQEFIMKR